MQKLTDKQALFCKEYLIDLNATQAAIRAGYSEKTAKEMGYENLTKPHILEEVQRLMKKRSEKVELTANDVLREIKDLLSTDITDVAEIITKETIARDHKGNIMYDENGDPITETYQMMRLKDTSQMSPAAIKSISEIGHNAHGLYIKRYDKQKTIEQAGRHLKLFTDKVEVDIKSMPKVVIGK